MAIEDVTAVVVPPEAPTESVGNWVEIEATLKTPLPSDYKAFIRRYGTGSIDDFIWVLNPFTQNQNLHFMRRGQASLDALAELQSRFPTLEVPDPLFPAPGGLLPWGLTDNGDVLYWATTGRPDEWTVVVNAARDARLDRYPSGMTAFLSEVLKGDFRCQMFPDDFPSDRPLFRAV